MDNAVYESLVHYNRSRRKHFYVLAGCNTRPGSCAPWTLQRLGPPSPRHHHVHVFQIFASDGGLLLSSDDPTDLTRIIHPRGNIFHVAFNLFFDSLFMVDSQPLIVDFVKNSIGSSSQKIFSGKVNGTHHEDKISASEAWLQRPSSAGFIPQIRSDPGFDFLLDPSISKRSNY